jgi:hypothetical protein
LKNFYYYFDDILIYSKGLDEYINYMEIIVFLGYVVSAKGIEMNEAVIKVIQK